MPGPPQNQPTGNGNIFQWLEEALLQERVMINEQLEQKHEALLVELKHQLANTNIKQVPETQLNESNGAKPLEDNQSPVSAPPSDGASPSQPTAQLARSPSASQSPPRGGRKGRGGGPVFASSTRHFEDIGWVTRLRHIIDGPYFEVFFGFVIVLSAIIMAMEMQYRGLETGNLVAYRSYNDSSLTLWPWADVFFVYAEWILGCLFTVEVLLKLFAQGRHFVTDLWNWVDVLIVGSWLVTAVAQRDIGFNPTLLRLFRLMRLLRLLKLLGMISIFDSLYLMTTAIKSSLSVLLWGVLVLTVVEMLLACLLQSMVEDYLRDPVNTGTPEAKEVFRHFGSFARSMLTMFEMTLGNWIIPCRALVENINEWYMLGFLMHKFIIGFSVVSVITGVFIQETFKVATSDDQIMMNTKTRLMKQHEKKMSEFFKHADADGNGNLDLEEFVAVMNDPNVKKWLSSMGLDVEDGAKLFDLVHGGDEHVNAHELVVGAGKLKGSARSIDLNILMNEFRQTNLMVESIHAKLESMTRGDCQIFPAADSSARNNTGNSFRPKHSPGGSRLFC